VIITLSIISVLTLLATVVILIEDGRFSNGFSKLGSVDAYAAKSEDFLEQLRTSDCSDWAIHALATGRMGEFSMALHSLSMPAVVAKQVPKRLWHEALSPFFRNTP